MTPDTQQILDAPKATNDAERISADVAADVAADPGLVISADTYLISRQAERITSLECELLGNGHNLKAAQAMRDRALGELNEQAARIKDYQDACYQKDEITEQAADLARVTESCKLWQKLNEEQAARIAELEKNHESNRTQHQLRVAELQDDLAICEESGDKLAGKLLDATDKVAVRNVRISTLTSQRDRLVEALRRAADEPNIDRVRAIADKMITELQRELSNMCRISEVQSKQYNALVDRILAGTPFVHIDDYLKAKEKT